MPPQQQHQQNQSLAAANALNLARSNSLGVQAAANAQANIQQAAQQLQLSQHHQQQQQRHLQQQRSQQQNHHSQQSQQSQQQQQIVMGMGMRSGLSSISSNSNPNLHTRNSGGSLTPGGVVGGLATNSSPSNSNSNSNSTNNNSNFIQPSHPHHPHHQAWLKSQHQASYNLQIQQQQQQQLQLQLQNHQQHAQLQQLQLQQAHQQTSTTATTNNRINGTGQQQQQQQSLRVQTNFPPQQQRQNQQQQQNQPSSPVPTQAQDSPRPLKSAITIRSNLPPPPLPPASSIGPRPSTPGGNGNGNGRQQQQTGSAPPTPGSIGVGIGVGRPSTSTSISTPTGQMIQINQNTLAANLAISGNGPITATASILGPGLAKLTALNESLTKVLALEENDNDNENENGENNLNMIDGLRKVVEEFFTDTGVLKYGLFDKSAALNKVFEIPCSAFPRFQHINSICGVVSTSLNPSLIREFYLTTPDPSTGRPIHVGYLLKAEETIWSSRFSSGVKVELKGSLMVHFVVTDSSTSSSIPSNNATGVGGIGAGGMNARVVNGLKVESIDFDSKGHEEFIVRESLVAESIERLYDSLDSTSSTSTSTSTATSTSNETTGKPVKGGKKSTTVTGGTGGTAAARRKSASKDEIDVTLGLVASAGLASERQNGLLGITYEKHFLPESPVGSFGVTEMGMRCLEIAESVAQLQDLIAYSLETNTGPIQSLAQFVDLRQQQQQSIQLQPSFSQHSQPPTPLNGPIASNSQSNPFYSSIPQQPHSGPPSSPRAPGINSNMNSPPSSSAPTPSNSGGGGGTKRKNTDNDLAPAIPIKGTRGRGRGRGRGMA